MKAYKRAEELEPDAPEIAFVEGLAHYDLKEFSEAREAFLKAAASADYALADDALYSLGTCDHVEALEAADNPQAALGLLESAMRQYHNVLANQPDHQAARDANFKAASMWRQIKQQLQQQPQPQQSQDGNEDEDKQEQEQESSPRDQQDGDEEPQPQETDEQQGDQQDPQQPSSGEKETDPQSAAEQQEQIPREQARRKLREMMQALRDRQKLRKQRVPTLPATPVDKDW